MENEIDPKIIELLDSNDRAIGLQLLISLCVEGKITSGEVMRILVKRCRSTKGLLRLMMSFFGRLALGEGLVTGNVSFDQSELNAYRLGVLYYSNYHPDRDGWLSKAECLKGTKEEVLDRWGIRIDTKSKIKKRNAED